MSIINVTRYYVNIQLKNKQLDLCLIYFMNDDNSI